MYSEQSDRLLGLVVMFSLGFFSAPQIAMAALIVSVLDHCGGGSIPERRDCDNTMLDCRGGSGGACPPMNLFANPEAFRFFKLADDPFRTTTRPSKSPGRMLKSQQFSQCCRMQSNKSRWTTTKLS